MSRFGEITYNPKTGRYHSGSGGFLSNADVKSVIRLERRSLESALLKLIDRYENGNITRDRLQQLASQRFKETNLRATVIGAGGQKQLDKNRSQYAYFAEVRKDLDSINQRFDATLNRYESGELSIGKVRGWAKYRSNSAFASFSKAETLTRIGVQGANEAKRFLDPDAKHCRNCPGLATSEWIPIEDVIPIGSNCICGGRCRCYIRYRFNPEKALNDIGKTSLASKIETLRLRTSLS